MTSSQKATATSIAAAAGVIVGSLFLSETSGGYKFVSNVPRISAREIPKSGTGFSPQQLARLWDVGGRIMGSASMTNSSIVKSVVPGWPIYDKTWYRGDTPYVSIAGMSPCWSGNRVWTSYAYRYYGTNSSHTAPVASWNLRTDVIAKTNSLPSIGIVNASDYVSPAKTNFYVSPPTLKSGYAITYDFTHWFYDLVSKYKDSTYMSSIWNQDTSRAYVDGRLGQMVIYSETQIGESESVRPYPGEHIREKYSYTSDGSLSSYDVESFSISNALPIGYSDFSEYARTYYTPYCISLGINVSGEYIETYYTTKQIEGEEWELEQYRFVQTNIDCVVTIPFDTSQSLFSIIAEQIKNAPLCRGITQETSGKNESVGYDHESAQYFIYTYQTETYKNWEIYIETIYPSTYGYLFITIGDLLSP